MTLSANNGSGQSRSVSQRIKLPQPDLRNITVLTDKLPNVPILPWNHYDLPEPEVTADPSAEDTHELPPTAN
jgi:hypothetical protein